MIKRIPLYLAIFLISITQAWAQDERKYEAAPAFTLMDASGVPVSLSDYRGKPLILHFWATWCPYCKKLQPGLNRLQLAYQEQGLEVLAISFNESHDATPQAVMDDRGHSIKTLLDGDEVAAQYGVNGTPTTFFINSEGKVIWVTTSSNPNNPNLEKAARHMLGLPIGKTTSQPE